MKSICRLPSPSCVWKWILAGILDTLDQQIQNTLRVVHSPVVEKLPVVDKTLPPNHFYLAKVPSSGQFPVVDKKWEFVVPLLSYIYHSKSYSWVNLRSEVIKFRQFLISKIEQDYTGEKLFNFHHCYRKFCQKYNLRVHDWIQIKQKPFNCHHCDKKFVQKNDLRVHERIHTGEKTFNCKSVTTVTRSSIAVNYNCIINSTCIIIYSSN